MDSVNESAVAQEKAKKSFGGRIVGWLIRAAIVIVQRLKSSSGVESLSFPANCHTAGYRPCLDCAYQSGAG